MNPLSHWIHFSLEKWVLTVVSRIKIRDQAPTIRVRDSKNENECSFLGSRTLILVPARSNTRPRDQKPELNTKIPLLAAYFTVVAQFFVSWRRVSVEIVP